MTQSDTDGGPGAGAPVLVVADDDADIRSMLVKALRVSYQVHEARDGEDARRLLEKLPSVDGLIFDIMMPRLDGLSLAMVAHKMPHLARTPILMLTARDGPQDVVAGINAGARHYLTKPFKLSELLAKVKAMTKAK